MLTSRITVPPPPNPETEDIFSSAIGALFTDDVVISHGTPGGSIVYRSPRFGEISLRIPAHPNVEDGRKLFAHYLWNAAVIVAEGIEVASSINENDLRENGQEEEAEKLLWDQRYWNVRGKRVLELGAGTALPSLIAALCGAKQCTITDHPSSPALTTGAIQMNVKENLFRSLSFPMRSSSPQPSADAVSNSTSEIESASVDHTTHLANTDKLSQSQPQPRTTTSIQVYGYTWGTSTFYSPNTYGKPDIASSSQLYDRMIIADCLWMPSQHENLVKTITTYLNTKTSEDGSEACAIVVAGFHTGRAIVRDFFWIATGRTTFDDEAHAAEEPKDGDANKSVDKDGESVRGRLRAVEMYEIDVNGHRRPWEPEREGEAKQDAKRWCVCAILVSR